VLGLAKQMQINFVRDILSAPISRSILIVSVGARGVSEFALGNELALAAVI
jgi:hypothetical protein